MRLILFLSVAVLTWVLGLFYFAASIPARSPDDSATDAIVVLTGGGNRLERGLVLLNEGKAPRLFVSGVESASTLKQVLSHTHLTSQVLASLEDRIELGQKARTTFGNAEETEAWAGEHQIRSIRLVTANYHIARSMLVFRARLPHIRIIPEPVQPRNFNRDRWFDDANSLRLVLSEYTKFLLVQLAVWLHAVP